MSSIRWVSSYHAQPGKPAPISVFPYRNRVSLNARYGCALGCAHCISQADLASAGGWRATPRQLLDGLASISHELEGYRVHIGDLSDPFLPDQRADTLALARGLSAAGLELPVALTSKLAPPAALLDDLAACDLKLTLYVSLGDVSGRVEPVPVAERLTLARRAHAAGLHTVLLLRPLHPAWCDPEELGAGVRYFLDHVDEVVLGGLRAPEAVRAALAARGIHVETPEDPDTPQLDPAFEAKVTAAVAAALPGVPISRTRACPSNRRYQLPCLTPAAARYPRPVEARPEGEDHLLRRDFNGYCRLSSGARPQAGLKPAQAEALEVLALQLDAAPAIPWRLIGGAARALKGEALSCDDLDVAVDPEGFDAAVKRLKDSRRHMREMNCKSVCSRCTNCGDKAIICELLARDRKQAALSIHGVKVDLTQRLPENDRLTRRVALGGVGVPIEV